MNTKITLTFAALLTSFLSFAQTTWHQVQSGTTKKMNAIDFPSASVGYIVGNDSLMLKSTNGGRSWSEVNYSGITFYPGGDHILKVDFVSENVGYITVGPYSGTYKTTNGGLTWTQVMTDLNLCYNQGLYFFNEDAGFVGGSGCFQGEKVGKLSAGVWTESTLHSPNNAAENYITDIHFLNQNKGLAISQSGFVYRTTDAGNNWDSIRVSTDPTYELTSVWMVNDTLAYATYASDLGFGMYSSHDAGLTWSWDMYTATFFYPDFLSMHETTNNSLYVGGYSEGSVTGLIFENHGDYINWSYQQVDEAINGLSSNSDSVVFGVGNNGYIVVNQDLETLGLENAEYTSKEINVYPNPFTESLTITLPENLDIENTKIKLYTIKGELVADLDQGLNYNFSALTQGVYLLEIQSRNKFFRKKLIKE